MAPKSIFGVSAKCLVALLAGLCLGETARAGINSISLSDVTNVIVDSNDIVFAEIAGNSDSCVILRKDSATDTTSDAWSFVLYSLSAGGDTRGEFRKSAADVFWGFSPGPQNTVLYTRDAAQSVSGKRSIYAGNFTGFDSPLLVSDASYPAYVSAEKTYNFAYVKDTNLYAANLQVSDSPSTPGSAVKIVDFSDASGTIRFPRWSPTAEQLVFMLEAPSESRAIIYILSNVQSIAAANAPVTSTTDSNLKKLQSAADTYYNAFPHFIGDSFVIFSRANDRAVAPITFKFSAFSETRAFPSMTPAGTNWDILLNEVSSGSVFPVDTATTTAAVFAASSHRGYTLLVRDIGDTEGDVYFAALQSTFLANATSDGVFYFPTNIQMILTAGAVPTCTFTVVPDTPKSTLRYDTKLSDMEGILVPVSVKSSVPSDSFDLLKIQLVLTYVDEDIKGFVDLANNAAVHDTGAPNWRSTGGTPSTSLKSVTFRPPHFSSFAVGSKTFYTPNVVGSSCLIQAWTENKSIRKICRRARDAMLEFPLGRRAVNMYYRSGP